MPYSHHSHSGQFCKHAKGTLQDVVLEAIRQRFELYGLTEHVPRYRNQDLYPEEESIDPTALETQFDLFIDEALRLKSLYASQITLLVGLETEYITPLDLDNLQLKILNKHKGHIDYLVGSIHHVNQIPIDLDFTTFQRCLDSFTTTTTTTKQERFLEAYFDAQYDLLQRFHPEIIGHLDLCRLYTPTLPFQQYPQAYQKLERNILFAVQYGALFELNAAAFNKGWDSPYPGNDVVQLILAHNGRFALSDDSHGPHAVGLNYTRLREYLHTLGLTELWHLQQSTVPNIAGRFVRAVKVHGSWCQHPFWKEIDSIL